MEGCTAGDNRSFWGGPGTARPLLLPQASRGLLALPRLCRGRAISEQTLAPAGRDARAKPAASSMGRCQKGPGRCPPTRPDQDGGQKGEKVPMGRHPPCCPAVPQQPLTLPEHWKEQAAEEPCPSPEEHPPTHRDGCGRAGVATGGISQSWGPSQSFPPSPDGWEGRGGFGGGKQAPCIGLSQQRGSKGIR